MTRLTIPILALALALAPAHAVAQSSEERARALFDQGVALSAEERWAEALEAFRASRDLVERPSTVFDIATVLQRLGRAQEAIAMVDRYLEIADPAVDALQIAEARSLRAHLFESLARVVVEVRPANAELQLDGRPVDQIGETRELVLDPGDHVVVLTAPGFEPRRETIHAAPGAREQREVELERVPDRPAQLDIRASREDARIQVDDHEVGTGRVEVALAAGSHAIHVEALDHRPFHRIVELAPSERRLIEAQLEPLQGRSIAEEPAFWIASGAILLAAGAGIAIGVVATQDAPPLYGGSLGVTIDGLRF